MDVFQPGLRRGVERLRFAPKKRYFYVEHPTEGWRVYLRAVCFLHELDRPFDPERFLVVKRTGGDPGKATWEPPKGQMEGRDGVAVSEAPGARKRSIMHLLRDTVRREVEEEAKVRRIRALIHTGLILQSREPDFPPNTFFQYHVFSGFVHPASLKAAFDEFDWIARNPVEFARMRSDQREKDAIDWYEPGKKKMMGRWSPTLVKLYLNRDHISPLSTS